MRQTTERFLARQVFASIVSLILGALPAWAQDNGEWARVRAILSGKTIVLAVKAAIVEECKFQRADDSSITVLDGDRVPRVIRREDVIAISHPETFHARHGLLIGLAAGAVLGVAKCGQQSTLVGLCGMAGGGIGLGLGAAVGGVANAFSHEREVIYHAASWSESASPRPRPDPLVGPGATVAGSDADDVAWSQVRRRQIGEHVRVILQDNSIHDGEFQSADNLTVSLAVAGRRQEDPRLRVRQVFVDAGTNRARHVGLGVAAGAVAGLVVFGSDADRCRRTGGPPPPQCGSTAPPRFAYSTGLGAVVGALLPARRVWSEIYIREPSAAR